jgi:hypothetical protein
VITVDAEAAREEGMLVGISSGATLAAIAQKLPELPAGAKVLGFNYDTGERYLSVEGFFSGLAPSSVVTGTEQVFAQQNARSALRKKSCGV